MARPGFLTHRKFVRLVHILGMPKAHVLGHVELLWSCAYAAGDDHLGDEMDVELRAEWQGEAGVFAAALLSCGGKAGAGLIEEDPDCPGTYRVHDLSENAPDYVQKRLKRREEKRRKKKAEELAKLAEEGGRSPATDRTESDEADHAADTVRRSADTGKDVAPNGTLPSPAQPSPTQDSPLRRRRARDPGEQEGSDPGEPLDRDRGAEAYITRIVDLWSGQAEASAVVSPASFQVLQGWYSAGIPLELALEAMGDVLEKRRGKGDRSTISSLKYFDGEVRRRHRELRDLTAPGHSSPAPAAPAMDIRARLEALAASIDPDFPLRELVKARLGEISPGGSPREVEEALGALEAEVAAKVEESGTQADRVAIDSAVERAVAGVRRRLGPESIEPLRRRISRNHFRVPALSLFATEVERAIA